MYITIMVHTLTPFDLSVTLLACKRVGYLERTNEHGDTRATSLSAHKQKHINTRSQSYDFSTRCPVRRNG